MPPSLRRSFLLLASTAAAMATLLAFLPAAGHDQLWFLLMARRWLSGATLYGPEIFDSNPPLIVWLSAIPVVLANLLHLPATLVAKALVLVLTAGVGLSCQRLLARTSPPASSFEVPARLFAFITLFLALPARDLGQRDALAGLLSLPYVLAAAARHRITFPRPLAIGSTLLAALGFCLKPQDALIAVAVEACLLCGWGLGTARKAAARDAVRRPEPYLLLICSLLYLLAIRRFAPLYFSSALPMTRQTYWAIGQLSLPSLLWEAIELTILAAVTLAVLARSRAVSPTVRLLFIAGSGAFLAYLAQGTGWYYQQLPALGFFGAALTLHLLDLYRTHAWRPRQWTVPAVASLCVLALLLTAHFGGYPFTRARSFDLTSPDPALFSGLPAGTPVAILTTSVDEAMIPVEFFHLRWAQRTDNLWLLPAILRGESSATGTASRHLSPAAVTALDTLEHRWMVEDLRRWRPEVVLVERCQDPAVRCQVLEDRHDDLLAWFQRDPAFAAQWGEYTFAGTHERFDAYRRKTP